MAEYTIDKIEYGGNVYKLQDNVSGYTTNTGTVTSVGISNATNGGLSISGSPITSSGTISVGHSNVLSSAQTTQAVYPIKIDKNGHISAYGSAVTIPTIPSNNVTGSGSTDYLAKWSGTNTLSSTSLSISTSYNSNSDSYGTIKLYVGSTGQVDWKGQLVFYEGNSSKTVTITPPTLTASRIITLPDKTGTIALTSDLPTVPSNIVNTITTTAGTHTAITSQKGNVSFNVPTKTSHLTNDSGFITSAGVTSITTTAGAHTAITSSTGAVSFKVPTTAAHVGAASSSHSHGNITNGGDITATAPTIASGDQIVINDHSASKITNGPTFDGSTTTTALTPKGTWETFSKFSGSYNDLTDKPTIPTVPSNIVNTITTTAGAHTAITSSTGAVSFNVPTKTSHLTNDSGFITNAGVTSITTTAGTHTVKTSATGAVSFNVPTKTSHLTNDSGFITSYTDEKLKWTASTSTNTYYPLVSTSTATTSTANTLNGINFYQYYNTAGGYRRLELGNTTANQSTGGAYGAIRLFGANATYYGDLVPGNPELGSSISGAGLSANRTWKLPDKSGTIALTSDVVPKPPDNGNFGWVLKYSSNSASFWDPPSGFRFFIKEDAENPGTYSFDGNPPENIQEAWTSGTSLVLELGLLNASDTYDTYTLTDYYAQEVPTGDGCYYVLWFTDIFRVIGSSQKKITIGIYLDELEVEHEYGEITVDVREIDDEKAFFYVNSLTSVTISSTSTPIKLPITGMSSGVGFTYDSTNKGIVCHKTSRYAISAQIGLDTATSGDLIGLHIYKDGTSIVGPSYHRVGGNYDCALLLPTIITMEKDSVYTVYIRNNTNSRGKTSTGVRISCREVQ